MSVHNNLRIHLAHAISSTAIAVTLLFPAYCLWMTPGDAHMVYQEYYQSFPTELPTLAQQIGGIPKSILLLSLIVITSGQTYITFRFRPRIWLGLVQLSLAAGCVTFAWMSQLAAIYLPLIKLFNALS